MNRSAAVALVCFTLLAITATQAQMNMGPRSFAELIIGGIGCDQGCSRTPKDIFQLYTCSVISKFETHLAEFENCERFKDDEGCLENKIEGVHACFWIKGAWSPAGRPGMCTSLSLHHDVEVITGLLYPLDDSLPTGYDLYSVLAKGKTEEACTSAEKGRQLCTSAEAFKGTSLTSLCVPSLFGTAGCVKANLITREQCAKKDPKTFDGTQIRAIGCGSGNRLVPKNLDQLIAFSTIVRVAEEWDDLALCGANVHDWTCRNRRCDFIAWHSGKLHYEGCIPKTISREMEVVRRYFDVFAENGQVALPELHVVCLSRSHDQTRCGSTSGCGWCANARLLEGTPLTGLCLPASLADSSCSDTALANSVRCPDLETPRRLSNTKF